MAAKTDLVLIPGLLCTRALWEPQIAVLGSKARITVADHARHDTMADIARAILATAPSRFALAGLSMGGYVAFEIFRQAPERITRLCLLDTSARPDPPEAMAYRRGLVAAAERDGFGTGFDELFARLVHPDRVSDPEFRRIVRAMADAVGVAGFVRQQSAIMGRADSRPDLARIACPTLVMVGREDALTPVVLHEELARGIAGSRLEIIEHCGHLSTLERPERVADLMAEWLDG